MINKCKVIEKVLNSIYPDSKFYLVDTDSGYVLYYDNVKYRGDVVFENNVQTLVEKELNDDVSFFTFMSDNLFDCFGRTFKKASLMGALSPSLKMLPHLEYLYNSLNPIRSGSFSDKDVEHAANCINIVNGYIRGTNIYDYLCGDKYDSDIRICLYLVSNILLNILPNVSGYESNVLFMDSSHLYNYIATSILDYTRLPKSSSF